MQRFVYWKVEERESAWKICKIDKVPNIAMFSTSMSFETEPNYKDENKDILNLAVVRYGDLTLDFDSKDAEESRIDTVNALNKLVLLGLDSESLRIYYSGQKGFHIVVPAEAFGAENGHRVLPWIYKEVCLELFPSEEGYKTLDYSMFAMKRGKMFRIANRLRSNGRYKIRISADELINNTIEYFQSKALSPQPDEQAKKPARIDYLSDLFRRCEANVVGAIKARSERKQAPLNIKDKEIVPCLKAILGLTKKAGDYSFNQMCFSAIVPALRSAGFTKSEAINHPLVVDFLENFEESQGYTSAMDRTHHLESVWDTDEKSPCDFGCGAMITILGKERSRVCGSCPIYAERMFEMIMKDYGTEEPKTENKESPTSVEDNPFGESPFGNSEDSSSDIVKNAEKEEDSDQDYVHPLIKKMNGLFAFTFIGGKSAIIYEDPDGESKFLTPRAAEEFSANLPAFEFLDAKGNVKQKPLFKAWMESKNRRQYRGVEFAPQGAPKGYYNLWRGFKYANSEMGIAEATERCKLFRSHVNEVICDGNEDHQRYMWAWLAHMVQKPEDKPGVAVVLRGEEGTGKGSFVSPFMSMLGKHGLSVANRQHYFSNFNGATEGKVLIYLDEAVWAGSKQDESILKSQITERTQVIERKGFESYSVHSCSRFIMSSNEDWVIPAGKDARRFFVLDVSSKHKQDTQGYFKDLNEEFENGGDEALYVYLKHYDFSGVNIREAPQTKALMEQKLLSLNSVQQWWYDVISDGVYPRAEIEDERASKLFENSENRNWPTYLSMTDAHDKFTQKMVRTRASSYNIVSLKKFRIETKRIFSLDDSHRKVITVSGRTDRMRVWDFPSKEKCVELFCEYLNIPKTEFEELNMD